MTTITIYWSSAIFGFLIGVAFMAVIIVFVLYGERWGMGFSEGWKCGERYALECEKESAAEEKRAE